MFEKLYNVSGGMSNCEQMCFEFGLEQIGRCCAAEVMDAVNSRVQQRPKLISCFSFLSTLKNKTKFIPTLANAQRRADGLLHITPATIRTKIATWN